VRGAGGRPRVVAALPGTPAADEFDGVDGLLLTGGDVDPSCYGEHPSHDIGGVDTERDVAEIELAHQAVERALPVLGICRGCQVLNVALGGTLVQHLPDVTTQATSWPSNGESGPRGGDRRRLLAAEARRRATPRGERIHHQAVERPAPGLRPVAWAGDRTIEALELSGRPVLGIQWRPENLLDDPRQRALWLVAGAVRVPDTADPASTDAAQSPGAPRG